MGRSRSRRPDREAWCRPPRSPRDRAAPAKSLSPDTDRVRSPARRPCAAPSRFVLREGALVPAALEHRISEAAALRGKKDTLYQTLAALRGQIQAELGRRAMLRVACRAGKGVTQ